MKEAKEVESEKNKTIEKKIMQTAILLSTKAKHLLIYNYQYLFLSFVDLAFVINARLTGNNFLLLILLVANDELVNY